MPAHADVPQGDMFVEYTVVLPTEVSSPTRKSESHNIELADQ